MGQPLPRKWWLCVLIGGGAGRPQFPAPARIPPMLISRPVSVTWRMSGSRRFVPAAQWEDRRHILGLEGERTAIAYLTSCGWSVESHRFKLGRHDIDLIVRRGHTVAFVEVKTRRSSTCGSGLEAVGWRKQRDIARVASVWMLRYGRPGDEYRFDLLSVQEDPGGAVPVLDHVPDAWRLRAQWADG